jgi:hypothetical protein
VRRLHLIALTGVLAVSGCATTGGVQVPAPTPSLAAARLCAALKPPATVDGHQRRTTSPSSPYTAAWGSPAIALRCGVPLPEHPATQWIVTLDGVDWLPQPADHPVTYTALHRLAQVEVTIPAAYTADHPAGDVLLGLTSAIKAAIPADT